MTQRKRYYQMKKPSFISVFSLFLAVTASAPAIAGDLVVTRYFSGLWEQSQHESQGIVLQVIDQEDEDGDPKAVAYWFTYGDDLESAWYMAIGEVDGDQVVMDLYAASGVGFLEPESDLNPVAVEGTLTLVFENCNKGMAAYTMGDEAGEFEIRRLAGLYNGRCSGGISDNTPGDAKPLKLEVDLYPPVEGATGEGEAKFWERSDRSDLHVSVEYLPDGVYDVRYCELRYDGVLEVVDGEGAVQFRSPEAEGKILLIEDPRDCPFDVLQGETVLLTSGDQVLGEKSHDHPDDDDDVDGVEVEVDLDNTGVITDAKGSVEYEVEGDERELSVQIRGVPAGSYALMVDNVEKGVLEVVADGEKTRLKLTDPQKADTGLLDFVPWNTLIEIEDATDTPVLEVMFPSE